MDFRLADWSDVTGGLTGDITGRQALARLTWAVNDLKATQPVALDLRGVTRIAEAFVDAFFVAILDRPPETRSGPCPIVAVGASRELANSLRNQLAARNAGLPISCATDAAQR